MRLALATALLALPPLLTAQEPRQEIEFTQASQLMHWCESEARAHFAGRGVSTYQWTSRYFDKGNLLMVEGGYALRVRIYPSLAVWPGADESDTPPCSWAMIRDTRDA